MGYRKYSKEDSIGIKEDKKGKDTTEVNLKNILIGILEENKYQKFKSFCKDWEEGKNQKINDIFSRDIVKPYKEESYTVTKELEHKDNPSIYRIYSFSIDMIVNGDEIVFWRLQKSSSFGRDEQDKNTLPERIYKSERGFSEMKKMFRNVYSANLNEDEMFEKRIVYGYACSITGEDPKERKYINSLVKRRNVAELRKWLQSTNTEKQMYAVDAFCHLKQKGYKIGKNDLKLIHCILSKEGNIYVCRGCIYSSEDIKSFKDMFDF